MSQKSYDNTPTLYLVPTPIGNLDDFTFRGVEILKKVDVIFSEDTRVTLNLLNHFNIKKHLVASHKFNEEKSSAKLLSYLNEGKSVALVTDRGTPLLSDPGNICVKKVVEMGYNVVSLPGATAAIPALTSSSIDSSRFLFYGFLNSKQSKRIKELELLKDVKYTIIFYEAPHRIIDTLNDMKQVFKNRYISISREISKKYEEIYRGTIEEVIKELNEPKGEFVIVVSGNDEEVSYDDLSVQDHVDMYVRDGYTLKDAIKKVAKDRNVAKNEIYREVKLFPGK
ncbi:ribosomal RNA small subunit methyltransferase I [Clostridium sp. CAG:1193]|nr:ribosomal RNA small subunit methyltransferase I [Clostridium sp. CAG:1193]